MADPVFNLIELEGIDLDITAFVMPVHYRGVDYVPVEIRQGGDRFEEFKLLEDRMKDEFAGGLHMHLEYEDGEGQKRDLDLYQLQLLDLTKVDEGPTGTRIILADLRYLLHFAPMAQSWNLLYSMLYQRDTALSNREPMTLLALLNKLPEIAPRVFANRMHPEALDDVADLQDAEIPPDQRTGGNPQAAALQKICEQWAVDLCVDPTKRQGQFYFANRADLPSGTLAFLKNMSEALDWIGDPPDLDQPPSAVAIPRYIKKPYWEDHNLEIPFVAVDELERATIAKGQALVSTVKFPHGMIMRQVFELGDTYLYLDELLAALDFVGVLFERSPNEQHSLGAVMMNPILFDSPLSPDGHTSDESDYKTRIILVSAIREGVRRLYSIEPSNGNMRAAWMNLTPGLQDATGVLRDARPRGEYTLLYQGISDEDLARPNRAAKLGEYFRNTTYAPDSDSAPFAVQRVHEGELVVQLTFKNFDGIPKADAAVPGKPTNLDMLKVWGDQGPMNEKLRKALKRAPELAALAKNMNIRENIAMRDDYTFAVYCVGRRYYPNDERKWWTYTIDVEADFGITGGIGEVMLPPSEDLFARRDHVQGMLGADGFADTVKVEKERPNGNDGFGICMNKAELKRDALREARAYVESILNRAGPTLPFAEISELANVRCVGRIDSWALKVNGAEFTGEVTVGPRADDVAKVRKAFHDQALRKAQIGGKIYK